MQVEEWKDVPNAPGYKISSYGNLLGKTRKPYKPTFNSKGYALIRIPMYQLCPAVHRVVALLWLGDPPFKNAQVNHKDGNKNNNYYLNLEYLTCKENINHAIKTGLRSATINLKSKSIFSNTQVIAIKSAIASGHGNQEISQYFGCHHSTISKIRSGAHYPKVSA